jgi:hypothetical protein
VIELDAVSAADWALLAAEEAAPMAVSTSVDPYIRDAA